MTDTQSPAEEVLLAMMLFGYDQVALRGWQVLPTPSASEPSPPPSLKPATVCPKIPAPLTVAISVTCNICSTVLPFWINDAVLLPRKALALKDVGTIEAAQDSHRKA